MTTPSRAQEGNEKGNARAPLLMRAVSPRLLPDVAAINARTRGFRSPTA
jgi:hypothetical protein